tara:strand:- start:96 stop:386 length:291 start_codon:yes stop_codon:yes gene_type:complete
MQTEKKVGKIKNIENTSKLYKTSVVIRTAVATAIIPCGHIILEPFGVPHGTAEHISMLTAGLLFTPEMIAMNTRIAIENIKENTKNIQSKISNTKK